MYLPTYIGAFIIAVSAIGAWSWLGTAEENKVVDIMASQEPELGLPVYAQFTVTQTFTLEKPTTLHRLQVPLYFPSREAALRVSLFNEDGLLWRWQVVPGQEGTIVVDLPMLSAWPQAGQLELTFAAPEFSHEEQAAAPRLFIESADEQYPPGHFRIAENDKHGDISFSLYERRTIRDRLLDAVSRRPLKVGGQAGAVMLVVLLAASLPSVLARTVRLARAKQVSE